MKLRLYASLMGIGLWFCSNARGDTVQYASDPGSYPNVTVRLFQEYGNASFPPLNETTLSYYQVDGVGPVTLAFRLLDDTGAFVFNFGYYRYSPALAAIDTSTTTGKIAYATAALAPDNATLVFDNAVDFPGAVRTVNANGGDILGLFLIPDASLQQFQTDSSAFAVDGTGSATLGFPPPLRWPFFGPPGANPGDKDQLLSFSGTSVVSGNDSKLLAWEDLTRADIVDNPLGSDNNFNDLVVAVEGVTATVPEPSTLLLLVVGILTMCCRRRPKLS
jgi:hypothetical protein